MSSRTAARPRPRSRRAQRSGVTRRLVRALALLATAGLLALLPPTGGAAAEPGNGAQDWIVFLEDDVDSGRAAALARANQGAVVEHVYETAIKGYSARMSAEAAENLRNTDGVSAVVADQAVSIAVPKWCTDPNHKKYNPDHPTCGGGDPEPPGGNDQVVPTGVSRVGGPKTGTVNVDVAILDTGVANHPDLDVVGGVNCMGGDPGNYGDGHGHGTHVAGTVAALDNTIGVVGVAPGARIWAVKVLSDRGSGSLSTVLCGIDWVAARAGTIEVANMSLGGSGSDGSCTDNGYREAVCNLVGAGVTLVVAAGNSSADAANFAPATFPEAITVSALTDSDGAPGGLGPSSCRSTADDNFADYSNYGSDVDIIAPGSCILSTSNTGGYVEYSGTSMASPHVAGGAALVKAANPGYSPAQVGSALRSSGSYNWNAADDPDGIKEPLLDISGL